MHPPVPKTYKLFIDGAFVRTESGRSAKVAGPDGSVVAHVCRASRKDLRAAVEAARGAQRGWAERSAYNRGQVLYRMAEMLEGKRREMADALEATGAAAGTRAQREVEAAIDRLVSFAGWTDKLGSVLGCHNPVDGPYYTISVPEPAGVVVAVPPDEPALLGLVTLLAPPLCAGNAVVAAAGVRHPLPAALLGEVCATADVPAGVVNCLTADRDELIPHIAAHRDVDAVAGCNLEPAQETALRAGAAENLKRVAMERFDEAGLHDDEACHGPWRIEPFVEIKTIWHPAAV